MSLSSRFLSTKMADIYYVCPRSPEPNLSLIIALKYRLSGNNIFFSAVGIIRNPKWISVLGGHE
jgi:hypothetical protein